MTGVGVAWAEGPKRSLRGRVVVLGVGSGLDADRLVGAAPVGVAAESARAAAAVWQRECQAAARSLARAVFTRGGRVVMLEDPVFAPVVAIVAGEYQAPRAAGDDDADGRGAGRDDRFGTSALLVHGWPGTGGPSEFLSGMALGGALRVVRHGGRDDAMREACRDPDVVAMFVIGSNDTTIRLADEFLERTREPIYFFESFPDPDGRLSPQRLGSGRARRLRSLESVVAPTLREMSVELRGLARLRDGLRPRAVEPEERRDDEDGDTSGDGDNDQDDVSARVLHYPPYAFLAQAALAMLGDDEERPPTSAAYA